MRKVKKLSMTLLTLVMLVVCFSTSTMAAHAAISSGTYVVFCNSCNATVTPTPDGRCRTCGRTLSMSQYSGSCTESWNEPNSGTVTCGCTTPIRATSPHELCPDCGHYAMRHSGGGGSSGGGGTRYPPAIVHTHSYGPTNWGQWS